MKIEEVMKFMSGEEPVLTLRRHPISLVGDLALMAVLGVAPLGAFLFVAHFLPALLSGPASRPILTLFVSAYYLGYWLFLMTTFLDYYLDVVVVTTSRIMHVEQHGLFSRTVSEVDISRVQDVTSDSKGILSFLFGYGTVMVQTAGEMERFVFEQMPHAETVRETILGLVEADQKKARPVE